MREPTSIPTSNFIAWGFGVASGRICTTRGEGVFHHEIVLIKDQDRLVVEPVWVELRADDDHVVRLVWNGEPTGDDEVVTRADGVRVTHVMRATTRTELKSVTVDPRQRIVQTARIEPRHHLLSGGAGRCWVLTISGGGIAQHRVHLVDAEVRVAVNIVRVEGAPQLLALRA